MTDSNPEPASGDAQPPPNAPPPSAPPPSAPPPNAPPPNGPGQYGPHPYDYGHPGYGYQQPFAPPGFAAPAYGYGAPYHPALATASVVDKPVGWFVVNWIFFWPIALYSLLSAWQNIDRAIYVGDVVGARYQCARVKKLGIIGLSIGLGLFALGIVLDVVVFAVAIHHANDCSNNGYSC